MKKTKKLTRAALFTAMALVVFVIESQIPPLTPIPGIKPGLANIFTIAALLYLGMPSAVSVTVVRIVLGALITGQTAAIMYSFAGAVPSLIFSLLTYRKFMKTHIWPISCISAVIHNAGQLTLAVIVTGTVGLAAYFPVLIISGIITGAFTGLCTESVYKRLHLN